MAFETVYKVPEDVLNGVNGSRYLRKEDLEKLTEHNLLFFLRESRFKILDDYPCMGAWERKFKHSEIMGPYEIAPTITEGGYNSESQEELVGLLVPVKIMPIHFKEVILIDYGTRADVDNLSYFSRRKINPDKISEVGSNILEKLKAKTKLEESDSVYKGRVNDCVFEFKLNPTWFYPDIQMTIFGNGGNPFVLFDELGLSQIEAQFPSYDVDFAIDHSTKKGLAYDLSLEDLTIQSISKSKSIIL